MSNCTNEYRVQCRSCRAEIGVSVHARDGGNATTHEKAVQKDSANEQLVEYGWLPTSRGYYFPRHAPEALAGFRARSASIANSFKQKRA
jgi:hypothetical protein